MLIMTEDVFELNKKASQMILSMPKSTRFRVISHYDADGISAAAIICKTLFREGYEFHVSLMRNPFTKGLERVKKEENEIIIFTDMGSGQIDMIEQLNCKAIIIDHHQIQRTEINNNIIQINANQCGINGNYEASGSSLCFSLAITINSGNMDLAALALVGATGDKQYIGGIRGYNRLILDDALKNNVLKKYTGIKLSQESIFNSLYYSIDPYYSGLSGDKKAIKNLLNKLNIEEDKKVEDLDKQEEKKINSFLLLTLIKNGCEKNILDTVIRDRYWSKSIQCELERFADLVDACGKGGKRGLGLAICLGDKNSYDEAISIERKYKQEILNELLVLEENGFLEKDSFKYFYSKKSSIGGVIGGIAINYLLNKNIPLFSIVRKEDELHISCRGTQNLVKNGLDLGLAMKKVAFDLKGNGGGHKIAAGATIDADKETDFLDKTETIISKQLKEKK
jgi:RecJ-like exonuclease